MRRDSEPEIPAPTTWDITIGKDGGLYLPEEITRRWDLSPDCELTVKQTPYGVYLSPLHTPLSKVYVEPTTLCNLKCRTCVRNSWSEPTGSMSMSTFKKLLDDLEGVPSLGTMAFWGIGEPLVHPDIAEMVGLAHQQGIRTELITNGHLLNKDISKRLIEAGLDTLVVSVDGVSSEAYKDIRCGGDLQLIQENIDNLHKIRRELLMNTPEVGIEFVLMQRNLDQLPQLRDTAFSLGAKFIVLTNLLPYTEDMKDEILYGETTHYSSNAGRSRFFPEFMLPRLDMLPKYMEPIFKFMQPFGRAVFGEKEKAEFDDFLCPFIHEGSAAVTWTGDVSPCIALMHSYRCFVLGREKSIRRYTIGNVAQENMTQIWNKQEYSDFRKRVKRFEFAPCISCGGCEFSDSNEEDCVGNVHPVCGDCLWARRVILCP